MTDADTPQGAPASDRPEPRTIAEAFARINRTPEHVGETAYKIIHSTKHEYDQGLAIALEYDDAFDLAEAFGAVLALARRLEDQLDTMVQDGSIR